MLTVALVMLDDRYEGRCEERMTVRWCRGRGGLSQWVRVAGARALESRRGERCGDRPVCDSNTELT